MIFFSFFSFHLKATAVELYWHFAELKKCFVSLHHLLLTKGNVLSLKGRHVLFRNPQCFCFSIHFDFFLSSEDENIDLFFFFSVNVLKLQKI